MSHAATKTWEHKLVSNFFVSFFLSLVQEKKTTNYTVIDLTESVKNKRKRLYSIGNSGEKAFGYNNKVKYLLDMKDLRCRSIKKQFLKLLRADYLSIDCSSQDTSAE